MIDFNEIAFGLATNIGIFLAGWCYVIGGLFEFIVCKYKLYPIEALKLFHSIGNYPKRMISVMYLDLQWNTQDEKLSQEFNRMFRVSGVFGITFFGIYVAISYWFLVDIFLNAQTTFEQINWGIWLLIAIIIILPMIQTAFRLMRLHHNFQKVITDEIPSPEIE